ncbi:MAG: PEP-CTERM sorting domain-containing protein [Colwellia sp.]|nr:PEP-CTERM sorting domain-containing protein [Colwellia sp.]
MKKFIAMLTLLVGFNATAGLLTIDLSADEVSVGDSVLVTISASEFEESFDFGFNFNFDDSGMIYQESSLTSGLALSIDTPMFDGLEVVTEDFGLNLTFLSDDDSIFAAGNFVLASFYLIADATGSFDFSITDLYDDWTWVDHTVDFSGASSVNVSAGSTSVPEPSSAALLLLAGFAFASSRRKKQ